MRAIESMGRVEGGVVVLVSNSRVILRFIESMAEMIVRLSVLIELLMRLVNSSGVGH